MAQKRASTGARGGRASRGGKTTAGPSRARTSTGSTRGGARARGGRRQRTYPSPILSKPDLILHQSRRSSTNDSPGAPSLEARHHRPPRDSKISAIHRSAAPKIAFCAPSTRGRARCSTEGFRRISVAESGDHGFARGNRGVPGTSL